MSITQDRLHDLLVAGETALLTYDHIVHSIRRFRQQIKDGVITPAEASHKLTLMIVDQIEAPARVVIGRERYKYDLTHKRNNRVKEHKRAIRQGTPGVSYPPPLTRHQPPPRLSAFEIAQELDNDENDLIEEIEHQMQDPETHPSPPATSPPGGQRPQDPCPAIGGPAWPIGLSPEAKAAIDREVARTIASEQQEANAAAARAETAKMFPKG